MPLAIATKPSQWNSIKFDKVVTNFPNTAHNRRKEKKRKKKLSLYPTDNPNRNITNIANNNNKKINRRIQYWNIYFSLTFVILFCLIQFL